MGALPAVAPLFWESFQGNFRVNFRNSSVENFMEVSWDNFSLVFNFFLQNTDLRDNLTYLKWYGMIGSTLIMVLIPAVVLIWSAFAMCMGIPEGNQRKKIVRIMIIIIAMFIICHVPKVSRRVLLV